MFAGGVFVVLLCGLALAILVAILEFCWNSKKNAQTDRVSFLISSFLVLSFIYLNFFFFWKKSWFISAVSNDRLVISSK